MISNLFPAALIASYACFRSGVNCRHGGHLYRERATRLSVDSHSKLA